MAQKIVAFVARSFDPADEAKINPIIEFLNTFSKLGFITQSAERSEVESVSVKVRSLIDKSEVLVGILTQRHPLYLLQGRIETAFASLTGKLNPSGWSAPPWVLQESGYVLKGNKGLILFRETGVEIPALQGDLEYIPYDPRNPAPAFRRASEMITGLLAKAGSITVETVVQSQAGEVTGSEAGAPPISSEGQPTGAERSPREEDLKTHMVALYKTVQSRNWEASEREYQEGLAWIRAHEPDEELFWKCFYQRGLFSEGRDGALDELRNLASENKHEYLPLSYLASCLVDLHEHEEAIKYLLSAASLAKPEQRASLEIRAAKVLHTAKRASESRKILLKLRDADYAKDAETQFRILQNLYSVSKESEDKFPSFAIGELALHQRPEDADFRFTLAFDYDLADQNALALHHYKILCDQDEKHPSGLNNLAVASTKCNLAILAAQHYKRAYELGDTLAASNLCHRYLEAGLSEEALGLLKGAQTKENCVPEVSRTVSAVYEKIEENNRDQTKVLTQAEEHRNFLLAFATGLFCRNLVDISGKWCFPFVDIDLLMQESSLHGAKETHTPVSAGGISLLFAEAKPKSIIRIERYEFSASMQGRTCKFKFENSKSEEP